MDWEKVAFKDFSGDMCKLKWVEISNEVTDTLPPIPDTQEHTSIRTPALTFLVWEMKQKSMNRKERDRVHFGRWYSRQHWPRVLSSTSF